MADDVLVVMALPEEEQGVFTDSGVPVLFTGVGKVNAALALARELAARRAAGRSPRLVANFGTAGSRVFPAHSWVACRRFVQRDMDVSPLGFARGITPFDEIPGEIEFPPVFTTLPEGVLGTGDGFETDAPAVACDVVDMEGYALAKACRLDGVAFACVKYVTDGHDDSAAHDWTTNLHHAVDGYRALYEQLRLSRR